MTAAAPLVYFVPDGEQAPAWIAVDGFNPPTKRPVVLDAVAGALMTPLAGALNVEIPEDPAAIRWFPIVGKTRLGVFQSLEARAEITPERLARPRQRGGHLVTLGDGRRWLIPAARLVSGGSALPQRRVFDDAGAAAWKIEDDFSGLADFAGRMWDARTGGAAGITDDELDRIAGEALAVNYRLHWREAIALGLITDDAMRGIAEALIDWPTVERILAEKKTA